MISLDDNKTYLKKVEQASPNSPKVKNIVGAFLIGGAICILGQALVNSIKLLHVEADTAAGWTSIILVFLGAVFTGLGLYDSLAKFAGAGTLVPITGFANAMTSPALEFKTEGLITGLAARMFIIAGPVVVYGVITAIVTGAIRFWLFGG